MTFAAPTHPGKSRLTSGYGLRVGRSGRPTFHAGLDFLGRRGDPVYAVLPGVVVAAIDERNAPRSTRGYGNVLALQHDSGDVSIYAHLDRLLAREGQRVDAGKIIGHVGNSSNGKFPGMGAHLHFEVRRGEDPFPGPYRRFNIDPRPWLEAIGVGFDARGRYRLVDGSARLSTAPGLGQLPELEPPAELPALDMDAEGLPEEPLRDPNTFDPVDPVFLVGVTAASVAAAVGGVTLYNLSR